MLSFIFKIFFFLGLLSCLSVSTVDEQIEAIEEASPSERFKMMDCFKQELIKLQEEERIDAMKKLISISESNNSQDVMNELIENSQEQNSTSELEVMVKTRFLPCQKSD